LHLSQVRGLLVAGAGDWEGVDGVEGVEAVKGDETDEGIGGVEGRGWGVDDMVDWY
jgi:hypothetical protein